MLHFAALFRRARLAIPSDLFDPAIEHRGVTAGIANERGVVDARPQLTRQIGADVCATRAQPCDGVFQLLIGAKFNAKAEKLGPLIEFERLA